MRNPGSAFRLGPLLIALAALTAALPLAAQIAELPRSAPVAAGLLPDKLDALTARLRADVESKQLAGAVVLVARQGRIAYLESVGVVDPATGKPMADDAIFRIYSMTKPVTTVAAMMLVEDGKLGLDDPVERHLPAFAAAKIGHPAASSPTRTMTLRDLMRHTAGLDYMFLAPASERARLLTQARRNFPRDASNAEFAQWLAQAPLASDPGAVWNYSHATDVLGRVVEVASGKGLGAFMAERIFDPLDMRDTTFRITDAAKHGRLAEPLASDNRVGASPMFDPRLPRRTELGGEGLVSTARDYARFLQMLLNGGELDGRRLLRPETIAEMTRDQLGTIARGPAYLPGTAYGFGLGFAVRTGGREIEPPGEPGDYWWGGGGGTYFWVDPKNQMFTILMMQSPKLRASYRPMLRQMVYDAMQR